MPAAPTALTPRELAAWRGMLRVHATVMRRLDAELETGHGLSVSSYEVLITLAESPGGRLRMAELADRVLLSRSGTTRLVDRLVRAGHVRREACESDARGSFAVLEDAGRALLAVVRPAHLAGVRREFLSRLGEEELETLAGIWERVLPGATGEQTFVAADHKT